MNRSEFSTSFADDQEIGREISAEQRKFAKDFHARVRKLVRSGKDPWDIFLGMHDQARRFNELMDAVGHRQMLRLAKRYDGIWCYVHILGRIADSIDSGAIQLSPEFKEKWANSSTIPKRKGRP